MRKALAAVLIISALPSAQLSAKYLDNSLALTPEGGEYTFRAGETVRFGITLEPGSPLPPDAQGSYRFSLDNTEMLEQGGITLRNGSAELSHSLDYPGFLRLDVELVHGADTLRQATAVGFSPEAITPTSHLPDDYYRFWSQGIAELMRVPPDPRIEKLDRADNETDWFLVSLGNVEGSRIYGWLNIPRGGGPFPAVVHIPGAPGGINEFKIGPNAGYAANGIMSLSLNIHGIEPGKPDSEYASLLERLRSGFSSLGADDPYRYYYRRVVLGAVRAADYLLTRDDVDSSRLAVAGGSQGGGLALITASIDKRFTAASIKVPAMCDHTGPLHGRPAGWPYLLRRNGSGERVIRTSRYYDGALAAGLIRVPTLITVSLLDLSCPPMTVYSAYNSLRGPREIFVYPDTDHPRSFTPERSERMISWLARIFGTR